MLLGTQKSRFNPSLQPDKIGEDSSYARSKYAFNIKAEQESNLILDSDDRNLSAYPLPNNFLLPIPSNQQNIYRIKLHDVYGWYDIPNIITGRNDTFTCNGTLITLTEGFYDTPASMASHIQTRLQALVPAGGTWTVSINASTRALTLSHSVITNYLVVGNLKTEQTYGIRNGSIAAIGATYTGKIPTLQYSKYFDVLSKEITKYSRSDATTSGHSTSLLFRYYYPPLVPNDFSFQDFNPKPISYVQQASIPNVDITIIDEYGELLYIPSYSNFSLGIVFQVVANPI
jgi:hypothetical protein